MNHRQARMCAVRAPRWGSTCDPRAIADGEPRSCAGNHGDSTVAGAKMTVHGGSPGSISPVGRAPQLDRVRVGWLRPVRADHLARDLVRRRPGRPDPAAHTTSIRAGSGNFRPVSTVAPANERASRRSTAGPRRRRRRCRQGSDLAAGSRVPQCRAVVAAGGLRLAIRAERHRVDCVGAGEISAAGSVGETAPTGQERQQQQLSWLSGCLGSFPGY